MAKATPGPLVGSITGRISGLEFGSGRSGIVIRRAKPRRRKDTVDAVKVRAFTSWFWSLWHSASADMRYAWSTYAAQNKVLNRNSQYVTLSAQKSAFAYHFQSWDWLGRVLDFSTATLQQPPTKAYPIPQPINPSLSFSTSEYILHAEHSISPDPVCVVYAARGKFHAWTTIKSWRFVCAYSCPTGDNDLISYFTALDPPWELLEGEHIYLRFYWDYGNSPLIPNFRTYLYTDVTA
jgi:hypothetical protein